MMCVHPPQIHILAYQILSHIKDIVRANLRVKSILKYLHKLGKMVMDEMLLAYCSKNMILKTVNVRLKVFLALEIALYVYLHNTMARYVYFVCANLEILLPWVHSKCYFLFTPSCSHLQRSIVYSENRWCKVMMRVCCVLKRERCLESAFNACWRSLRCCLWISANLTRLMPLPSSQCLCKFVWSIFERKLDHVDWPLLVMPKSIYSRVAIWTFVTISQPKQIEKIKAN